MGRTNIVGHSLWRVPSVVKGLCGRPENLIPITSPVKMSRYGKGDVDIEGGGTATVDGVGPGGARRSEGGGGCLVGELRLAGAATMEEANQPLWHSLPQLNDRFAVPRISRVRPTSDRSLEWRVPRRFPRFAWGRGRRGIFCFAWGRRVLGASLSRQWRRPPRPGSLTLRYGGLIRFQGYVQDA